MTTFFLSLPGFAALLGFAYLLSITIYNYLFHPLRKYPGPLIHRISHILMAYHQMRGTFVHHVKDLHEKYGPIIRIGPNELSYIDERAWPDIYGHRSPTGSGNLPKDLQGIRPDDNHTADIITANEADHRRFRRIQTSMFSERAVAAQEQFLNGYAELLTMRLMESAKISNNVVDMVLWYTYTTFDILGELAFGESFDCLNSNTIDSWIELTLLQFKDSTFWNATDKFMWPISKILYQLTPRKIRDTWTRRTELASRKVSNRIVRNSNAEKVDYMSHILAQNDEKGMTRAEIENNARVLIIAGSETSSTLLSGLTYFLLQNPEHLEKLTQLIRTTFPEKKDITIQELNKLEYLSAVIHESFRMYPPVPGGLRRKTIKGGSVICGEVVPENTSVSVANYAGNTSASNWTDPEIFAPERWFKDDKCPERYRGDKRKVMQPFSFGPRNCIGKNLAAAEIRILIAHMLWNFDLELGSGVVDWTNQKVFLLWDKPPLPIKIFPRKF